MRLPLGCSDLSGSAMTDNRMRDQSPKLDAYPLLESLLRAKGLSLKGAWRYRDVTEIFDCSVRSLQELIRTGKLRGRNLPGRAKFLSIELEEFLENSVTPKRQEREK